jgi:hypothetical protein
MVKFSPYKTLLCHKGFLPLLVFPINSNSFARRSWVLSPTAHAMQQNGNPLLVKTHNKGSGQILFCIVLLNFWCTKKLRRKGKEALLNKMKQKK